MIYYSAVNREEMRKKISILIVALLDLRQTVVTAYYSCLSMTWLRSSHRLMYNMTDLCPVSLGSAPTER